MRTAAEVGDVVEVLKCRGEAPALGLGESLQAGKGGVANASARRIDDAAQGNVVGWVDQQPQIGQHIADFAAVVKADAPDDYVGQAGTLQLLFKESRLGVSAVEHRGVPEAVASQAVVAANSIDDVTGLAAVRVAFDDRDWIALGAVRPQLFALAALVVADDGIGGGEDAAGGAVVLLQPH